MTKIAIKCLVLAANWGMLLPAGAEEVSVSFQSRAVGAYIKKTAKLDWPGLLWESLGGRAYITADPHDGNNRVLRVDYPSGKIGSKESGAQMLVKLPEAEEYVLSYRLRFCEGFEWTRGGKLPGLTSGGSAFTGGKKPDGTGWSARFMWRPGGKLVVYLYHLDQRKSFGEDVPLRGFTARRGEWHHLKQRIRVNEGSQANGILQVWVDGELALDKRDVRYRESPHGLIDHFYFSTFYGGSSQDFAPKRDQEILFDDFVLKSGPSGAQ